MTRSRCCTAIVEPLLYKRLQLLKQHASDCHGASYYHLWKRRSFGDLATSNGSINSLQAGHGVFRLLTNDQRELLNEQRMLTCRATKVAEELQLLPMQASTGIAQELESSMFSIVVAGEFNAGKSSVINALLGEPLLEMGPLPTTDCITIVTGQKRDSNAATTSQEKQGVVIHRVSSPNSSLDFLNDEIILVDTPGTNTLASGHEYRTKRWLPLADLILFVISADRPLSESERSFLQSMERYRKQIVIIINKMDLLESLGDNYGEAEKARVVEYVTENASSLLGMRPIVFPISARNALECKRSSSFVKSPASSDVYYSESALWKRSGFDTLQQFLINELKNEAKVITKLCNPVRVAESIARDALEALDVREKAMDSDKATLTLLDEQMKAWEVQMTNDLTKNCTMIENLFIKASDRISDSIRGKGRSFATQIMLYLSRDRFLKHCSQHITNKDDLVCKIDLNIKENSDSFAMKVRSQSQAVIEYLGKRPVSSMNMMVGNIGGVVPSFEQIQKTFYDKMTGTIHHELLHYEPEKDVTWLFQSLHRIASATCAIEFGAASILVYCTAAALSSSHIFVFNDATTPVLAASASLSMLSGMYVYPLKIQQTWKEYRRTSAEAIGQSISSLMVDIGNQEIDKLSQKIVEGVAPYKRFCQAESDRNQRLRTESEEILAVAHSLRRRIEKKTR